MVLFILKHLILMGFLLVLVTENLSAEDVFIKGANALDANGTAGILLAHPAGGTIGAALGAVMARGANLPILTPLVECCTAALSCPRSRYYNVR